MDPAILAPLIGSVLADPEQRAAVLQGMTAYCNAHNVGAIVVGDLDGNATHRLLTPEAIAAFLLAIIAGEMGMELGPEFPYPFNRYTPVAVIN